MTTIPYKGHVFTLTPGGMNGPSPGLDLSCGPHWLFRITLNYTPSTPIRQWLDRAIELLDLLNLTGLC